MPAPRTWSRDKAVNLEAVQPRVVLLIRSLERGGAERQTVNLALGLKRRGWQVTVVTFYDGGALVPELALAGVAHIGLGKSGRWDVFTFGARLVRTLRSLKPDIVYSILDVANVVAALVAPVSGRIPVVWGIRGSTRARSNYDRLHAAALLLERRLSSRVAAVIVNSAAGREHVERLRWSPRSVDVIPNGIERPTGGDSRTRAELRRNWGFDDNDLVFGTIGRLDPVKGHRALLAAAAQVAGVEPRARFLVVGDGPAAHTQELRDEADRLGLASAVVWAGHRTDMGPVFSAIDCVVSASMSEGFSNALAEGVAAEKIAIATAVGDSALIIGSAGVVVPAGDEVSLADALRTVADMPLVQRRTLGMQAADRVEQLFGVDLMVRRTEAVLIRASNVAETAQTLLRAADAPPSDPATPGT